MIQSTAFNYINVLDKASDASWMRETVIANNLANVDTPGYKRRDVDFESLLKQQLAKSDRYLSLDKKINNIDYGKITANAQLDAAAYPYDYRLDGNNVDVTQFGGTSQVKIALQYKENESSEEIDLEISDKLFSALKGFYKEGFTEDNFRNTTSESTNASIGIISSEQVGPSIAAETLRRAIIAVFLSLLAIFAYIAIRFKGAAWGLGGVVSLAHTALIVIGFFSLFTGILPFNLDVDQTFIAAILTIIGYAINDNVVIFDRIREFKSLHPKTPFKDNVNTALNATLTRTINTSVSTFITMFAIALFGGETIRGLAVALCLGVVIGTYASIFIGTPVMYDFTMWRENRRAAKKNASKK